MRVLFVYAHHEPSSFNGAMLESAKSALRANDHEFLVSDLYAQKFDPVSDRRNFIGEADGTRLDQQVEEKLAFAQASFSPDIATEMKKLIWCDTLILQFPLWWMGMPAVLKGWIDRVFALGFAYGGGRWFDRGHLGGRRAMLAVTTGGEAAGYSSVGLYGSSEAILRPIHHGVLAFVGFDVVEPFLVHGPARMSTEDRTRTLQDYGRRLTSLQSARILPSIRSEDYENFVRRSAS